jgi:V8-like Glu-specific endopeptidase
MAAVSPSRQSSPESDGPFRALVGTRISEFGAERLRVNAARIAAVVIAVAPNIFGPDNRVPTPAGKPWSAIGLIRAFVRNDDTKAFPCSAVLVARTWILSAGHCFVEEDLKPRRTIVFCGGPRGAGPCSDVIWGNNPYAITGELSDDWVIAKLKEPLGDRLGWIPLKRLDLATLLNLKVAAIGFPSYRDNLEKHIRVVDGGCSVRSVDEFVDTDCAITKGESGGPIIYFDEHRQPQIVGIIVGAKLPPGASDEAAFAKYDPRFTNQAIPVNRIVLALSLNPRWETPGEASP